jgi:hypothetical protein
MLKEWAEKDKKLEFDYIFNEIVDKIKTIKLTDEIKDELRQLTKEIYNAGLHKGIKEGILDF